MRARHSVHPLLLEPTYWRTRLQRLSDQDTCPLITPRPDLSPPGTDVAEFRLKAHDGSRIGGLFARPAWHRGPWPARIRLLEEEHDEGVDVDSVRSGRAEFLVRLGGDRRLEDRVLDVVRVCRLAYRTEGVDRLQVVFSPAEDGRARDELLIAEQLVAGRFV